MTPHPVTKMLNLPQAPESICVLRLSALGDVCNAVPAVRALQQRWPDCRITWIIGKAEHQLLKGLEAVEFVVYDKKSGIGGILALRRQLKGRRFDVLLHMQAALRASLVSLAVRADIRLGFDRARARDNQHWFTSHQLPPRPRGHVLEGFLDFAEMLGAERQPLRWQVPIPAADRQQVEEWLQGEPCMLISPCSSQRARNFRNWSAEGYARLVDYVRQQYGLRAVLTGGNSELERDYGAEICRLARQTPLDLIGKTSLKQLLALVDRARLVVAPDSGPMHMATATGTPALGLYASSNPDRTGPYLSRQWVVNRYPDQVQQHLGKTVAEISWGRRVRDPEVMLSITEEEVLAMLDRLMAAQQVAEQ